MSTNPLRKPIKTIATHSGKFHTDEALAIALLQELPEFANATIYRSRDETFLKTMDLLVDVGSIYDPETLRFDHHQRTFQDTFSPDHKIRLSSAGLVYKHFGEDVLRELIMTPTPETSAFYREVPPQLREKTQKIFLSDDSTFKIIYKRVYNRFIQGVDGEDNGVQQYPADTKPAYTSTTSLGNRVDRLNPSWIVEQFQTPEDKAAIKLAQDTHVEQLDQFKKAVEMCRTEFYAIVHDTIFNWLHGKTFVQQAVAKRLDAHNSGKIIALESFCPWKSHFFDMLKAEQEKLSNTETTMSDEEKKNLLKDILFVSYPAGPSFRYLAVPATESSFEIKPRIPKAWLGLRGPQLEEVSGIAGLDFIHMTGFTGGAKTPEALQKFFDACIEESAKPAPEEEKQ